MTVMESDTIPSDRPYTRTPLPRLQLSIVLLIQCAEPITASVIYPFINQFVQESGITDGDERKIGYYAGIIGSLFFLSECFTVLFWSRLSDRVGRKPILLVGMLGLCVTILSAGSTKTYIWFAASRCLQGAFNGNVGVARNVMVEISDPSNMANAFSFLPPVWTTGNTFGPIIGGSLARPADRWPAKFGHLAFFKEYPYFLPCAITSLFALLCFILGALLLDETLPWIVERRKRKLRKGFNTRSYIHYGTIENTPPHPDGPLGSDEEDPDTPSTRNTEPTSKSPPSVLSVLVRPVVIALTLHAFQAVTMESFRTLLPLMFSTSIPNGGLAFSSARIGTIMGIWGFCNGLFQLFFFAPAIRKFGAKTMFRIAYGSYAICFALYPILSYFAKQVHGVDWRVICILVIQLSAFVIGAMSYGSNQLFVIDSVPGKEALATVNGLCQIVSSMMRSFAPSLSSSLFSLSVEHNLAGGYMAYLVFIAIIVIGQRAAMLLPNKIQSERR